MNEDDMTDRELLELAAKAAGLSIQDRSAPVTLYIHTDGCKTGYAWNPLADDGDALRLAVKLHLDLDFEKYGCCANNNCIENTTMGYGLEEATRRAIVRAAAEIGKQLQS